MKELEPIKSDLKNGVHLSLFLTFVCLPNSLCALLLASTHYFETSSIQMKKIFPYLFAPNLMAYLFSHNAV